MAGSQTPFGGFALWITKKSEDINLTLGAQGRPLGKLTLSVGGLSGGGGGGGWMMTSRSMGSTSPSMPLSASSGSSSSSRASSFLKGSRSLYVSKLSCLTSGWRRQRPKVKGDRAKTQLIITLKLNNSIQCDSWSNLEHCNVITTP